MKVILSFFLFFVVFITRSYAVDLSFTRDVEYTSKTLANAKTAWYNFSEHSDGTCTFTKDLSLKAYPLIKEIEKFGLVSVSAEAVERGQIPDLSVLVTVESNSVKDKLFLDACSIFIKVEVFHSILGTLRYHESPIVMRVLAYRKFWFGAVKPSDVEKALQTTALHGIALFSKAYIVAQELNGK